MHIVFKSPNRKKKPKNYVIPPAHDPVLQYPLPPLTNFLDQPRGYYWFEQFLKENHSEENLLFCADVWIVLVSPLSKLGSSSTVHDNSNSRGIRGRNTQGMENPRRPLFSNSRQLTKIYPTAHHPEN
jgi:hypothetical protein